MKILKAILVFLSFMIFLIVAVLAHVVITFIRPSRRWHFMKTLSCWLIRVLRKILGMKVSMKGHTEILKESGNFIISRHVGYTDGLVLGGLFPVMLLSKKEIRHWPVIGLVVQISGTVFVNRQEKDKISGCLEEMVALLKNRMNVVVFPEGTSTDGTRIKPFQTVFFRVPIAAKAAVVPVTIAYKSLNGQALTPVNKDHIFWYGQIGFFQHLWNLFQFRSIEVEVTIHEKIFTDTYKDHSLDRKRLAANCFTAIAQGAGMEKEMPKELEQVAQ